VKERCSYHDHTQAKLITRDRSPDIRTAKLSFSTAKNSEYQRNIPEPFAVVPSVPTNDILRLYVGVNSTSSADTNSACDLSLTLVHNLYSSREEKTDREFIRDKKSTNVNKMAVVFGKLGVVVCKSVSTHYKRRMSVKRTIE